MEWQGVLISLAVSAGAALASWGLGLLTALIKGKIGNETAQKYLGGAVTIIDNAVKATYQTYVQALKEEDKFDKDAQLAALEKAKYAVLSQMSGDMKTYIASAFGDLDKWLETKIESRLYELKNGGTGSAAAETETAA